MATEAPVQQEMAEPKWVTEKQPPVSWETFMQTAQAPKVYDPPQFKKLCCTSVAWYTQTSGCCAKPVLPCCCASCCVVCCNSDAETFSLLDPDPWLRKMLQHGNKNCPDRLRGVWWMEGNQLNQEVLVVLEDADWVDDKRALKKSYENWSRTPTCFGIINITANYFKKGTMRIDVSPDGKWLFIDGYLIYILSPDEEVTLPNGEVLARTEHDMMRIDFSTRFNASTPPSYQYMVRRVAHLDADGQLVKTENFKLLQERVAEGKAVLESCIPQYFVRGDAIEASQKINPTQVIRLPRSPK